MRRWAICEPDFHRYVASTFQLLPYGPALFTIPFMQLRLVVMLCVSMLCYCALGMAQLTEATLKGSVRDASNGVVQGGAAIAVNQSTGQRRAVVTDGTGSFSMPGLAPGSYTLTMRAEGFKTYE